MISREGKVKVTDFGIARAASANTINGNAMGSVHYISPEQAGGQYVDEKSDIYSLGITMFEMLTGKVPFDGDSTVSIALKHIQSNVPSIREYIPDIAVSMEKIVLKCTQNKAEKRYPKISLLIADLKRALSEPNVDFVQLDETPSGGSTVMITDDEINQIRKESGVIKKTEEQEDIDNDIDAVNPKMDKIVTIGGVVVGILALVAVAVIITAFWVNNSVKVSKNSYESESETIDPYMTVVPNVVGISADEAEKILHENNLGYKYESEMVYSDQFPEDYIVAQSETAGDVIEKNKTVILTLSKGAEKIQIPEEIEDAELEDATDTLEELGLKWEATYEYSSKTIGTVISCSPSEKASVSKNDVIKLTVSRGQQSTGEVQVGTIPNVLNKEEATAEEKITAANFDVGSVRYEYSDTVEKGYVIRQTVKSGGTAPLGTTIGLVVSLGPENGGKYSATYTFALEDLLDETGEPITQGSVSVLLNGLAQNVPEEYSDVSKWTEDFTIELTGDTKGKATIELLINGKIVKEDTVRLK